MNIADLFVRLVADNTGFQGQVVRDAGRAGDAAGRTLGQRLGAGMRQAGKSISAGLGIGAGIAGFNLLERGVERTVEALRDMVDAAKEQQVAQALLTTALKQNDKAWDGNLEEIEKVIDARLKLGFTDNEQMQSLGVLVAMVKDHTAALAIERTAMDLARLKHLDLEKASVLLGKAYLGNVTALKRLGIFVDAGVTGMEALGQVQDRVKGQAEAFAATEEGAAAGAAAVWEKFQEDIGNVVLPMFTKFFTVLRDDVIPSIREFAHSVGPVASALMPLVQHLLPGLFILLSVKMVLGLARFAAGMLGAASATEVASATTAEHVAVEHSAATATEATTVATLDHTTATLGAAAAEEVETAAVAGEVVALEAETVAAEGATVATEALATANKTGAVAAKGAGISMRVLGVAAIFLIPIILDAAEAASDFFRELEFGKGTAKDLKKVTKDLGDGFLGLDPAMVRIHKAAEETGVSFEDMAHTIAEQMDETGDSAEDVLNRILDNARGLSPRLTEAARGWVQDMVHGIDTEAPALEAEAFALSVPVSDEFKKAAAEAKKAARQLPGDIARELKAGLPDLQDGMDDLKDLMKNSLSDAAKIAKLKGILASKELAAGLLDERADVRASAMAIRDAALTELNALESGAADAAVNAGTTIGEQLRLQSDEVARGMADMLRGAKHVLETSEWPVPSVAPRPASTGSGFIPSRRNLAVGSINVPETGIYRLHAEELVAPRPVASALRQFFGGGGTPTPAPGGGGVHIGTIEISGVGSDVSPAAARRFGQQVVDEITSGLRDQSAQIVRVRPVQV